jgi:type IV fimbrial biogenesis protein FimT
MLIVWRQSRQHGFTLAELLVGIFILGILAAIAAPSLQTWTLNSQVRNAAESALNGLQRARAEAVARNTVVEFVLGVGTSWVVRVRGGADIESRSRNEGSTSVTVTALAADLPITNPPTFVDGTEATTITFNNFGAVVDNVPASASLARLDFAIDGGTRPLQVQVGIGGTVRMCDPSSPPNSPSAC